MAARDLTPLPAIYTDSAYSADIEFFGADTSSAQDYDGSTWSMTLAPARVPNPASGDVHTLSSTDSTIVMPDAHTAGLRLGSDDARPQKLWAPGIYVAALHRIAPDASVTTKYIATVQVFRGLSQLADLGGGNQPLPGGLDVQRQVLEESQTVRVVEGAQGIDGRSAKQVLIDEGILAAGTSDADFSTWLSSHSDAAAASAAAALADRQLADADRAQADTDATNTAADRVQTGLDRAQADTDATNTSADRTATHADKVSADTDATDTAADRVQTGLDRAQTGTDAAAAHADRLQADADVAAMNFPVSYGVAQTLTAGQQAQARSNIDAPSTEDMAAADALKVSKAGDTMTGALGLTAGANYLTPALRHATQTNTGWSIISTTDFGYVAGGVGVVRLGQSGGTPLAVFKSNAVVGFGNLDINGALDSAFSRGGPNQINVGNGTAGDASGTLSAAAFSSGAGTVKTSLISTGLFWATKTGIDAPFDGGLRLSNNVASQRVTLSVPADNTLALGNGTAGDASGTLKAATVNATTFANPSGITVIGNASSGITLNGGARDNASPAVSFGWQVGVIAVRSTGLIGFTSGTTNATSLPDTAFSRVSAGVAALGTGAQGNAGGILKLTAVVAGPFTVATLPSAAATPVGAQTTVSDCANPAAVGVAVTGGGTALKGVINTSSTWLVD